MQIAAVVAFQNEEKYLPTFLASLAAQTRVPDTVVLVDDGSTDSSPALADDFAQQYTWARVLRRPVRPRERDRMLSAPEYRAFLNGVEQLDSFDVVVKMDADLQLSPDLFAEMQRQFEQDPTLGIAGSYLRAEASGGALRREENPSYHVRGPNKFYRRQCFDEIMPVPFLPGWETIDEIKARRRGWRTQSFELPSGDPIHLRVTGSLDGMLRGYRRDGLGAWSYGASPVWIALGMLKRSSRQPVVLGGINYGFGWFAAGIRRLPRADRDVRKFARHEQRRRIWQGLRQHLPHGGT